MIMYEYLFGKISACKVERIEGKYVVFPNGNKGLRNSLIRGVQQLPRYRRTKEALKKALIKKVINEITVKKLELEELEKL